METSGSIAKKDEEAGRTSHGRQLAFDFIKRMVSEPGNGAKGNSPKNEKQIGISNKLQLSGQTSPY